MRQDRVEGSVVVGVMGEREEGELVAERREGGVTVRSCGGGGGGGGGGEEVFGEVKGSEEVEVEVEVDDGLEIDGSLLELHNQPIVPSSEGCELIVDR